MLKYLSLLGPVPLAICTLSVWLNGAETVPNPTDARPNILVIFTDDQGWHDVGCYGSEIPTPSIDRLAKEGMRFTQFYAASSICTPSRFGLLTGQNPTRSQDELLEALMFLSPSDARRGLRAGERTYVQLLQQDGYRTALVGKWHLGHGEEEFWPTEHGFDSFFGHTAGCVDFFTLHYGSQPDWYRGRELVSPEQYATDAITNEAMSFLQQQSSSDQPFYLHVAFNAPHYGKAEDPKTGKAINVMQPKPEDLAKVGSYIGDTLRREFAATVMGMDESIGKLLDVLDDTKLAQNTLVFFMTDHGGDPNFGGSNLPLRGTKATLFEGGIRVPCIIRWPKRIRANSINDSICWAMDMYPTFCEAAGVDFSNDQQRLDGVSLWPNIDSGLELSERLLWWQTGKHEELGRNAWLAARHGKWKLVQSPGNSPMLFDLSVDPNETSDLSDKFDYLVTEITKAIDLTKDQR
ncbi:MAG: sulfatase-like hydrolase/transferase [Planctomycetales bacterium]|nr:sulfatase-like hydrolase/transferase [Planctomycetales bacterium]